MRRATSEEIHVDYLTVEPATDETEATSPRNVLPAPLAKPAALSAALSHAAEISVLPQMPLRPQVRSWGAHRAWIDLEHDPSGVNVGQIYASTGGQLVDY